MGVGLQKKVVNPKPNLDVKNILLGSHTQHRWRCSKCVQYYYVYTHTHTHTYIYAMDKFGSSNGVREGGFLVQFKKRLWRNEL
jgi:hypothetical protein